jgi:hypothetical protein
MARVPRMIGLLVMWFAVALCTLWAIAALYIDIRMPVLRVPVAIVFALSILAILIKAKGQVRAAGLCVTAFGIVLLWWLSLSPSNQRAWRADVAKTAWAEIDGDRVTIHNLRNCDYRAESEYTDCWHDRTVDLSQIRGIDFFFVNWGPRWIGHPIISFAFGDNQHIAFSIEARYEDGESYSAVLGFFRQYELIFIAADERDVIRLRTNYRKDEEVYRYAIRAGPPTARAIFQTYIAYLNKLREQPEWYNAATKNCTTTLDKEIAEDMPNPQPWSYQFLVNGTLDELIYNRQRLVTGGLPFPQLKERAHINVAARAADQSPDFSALIRRDAVGELNQR